MAPGGWVPFSDTEPTLRALKEAGIAVAVVSDAGWDIRIMFRAAGLEDYVDTFVLSYEVGVIKPAPEPFLRACTDVGVGVSRALMVGDNALPDGGALAAGIAVYLLPLASPGGRRGLDGVLRLAGVASATVPDP
jgi:HAD superfamily hydrolase (TIGR01509 family)